MESARVQHSRPLEFDPSKHKVLNSELKYLYTAITRARMNLWFFDQDEEARAPMYQYFRGLRLADVVTFADQRQETGQLASMFAVKSTPEEWRKRGIRFYKKSLWLTAIHCFTFAGDKLMLQKCQAQQQAAEAIKFRSTNRQLMRKEFLHAGERFLQCKMYNEAAICLNNAQEWILLAKLYEKTGKVSMEILIGIISHILALFVCKFDHISRLGKEFLPKLHHRTLHHTIIGHPLNLMLQRPLLIHETLRWRQIYRLLFLPSIFLSKRKS